MADRAHTLDHPAPGLVIAQPLRGFRYGAEAFWLVGWVLGEGAPRTAMDLGTGSGIMAALLARRGVTVTGVELRPEWQPLWQASLARSAPMPGLSLVLGDIREVEGTVDCVVSNPPFFPADAGPGVSDPWRNAARSETVATLGDFVDAAMRVLSHSGRALFVLPQERTEECRRLVTAGGGHVDRTVRVGRRRVILELRRGPGSSAEPVALAEDAAQVSAWVACARAGVDPASGVD